VHFPDAVRRLESVVLPPWATITEAVRRLERAGTGALLLCDADRRLTGVLTDGDVRRAILHRVPFDSPCQMIATATPVVAPDGVTLEEALRLLDAGREFVLNQLPLVDEYGVAVGLLLRSDLLSREGLPLAALIMAGGFGTRLLPLTEHTPKPLLPVGNRPLLDRIVGRLQRAGIREVVVSTHHLAEQITRHLGNGDSDGITVRCVSEEQPLGTAGAVRLVGELREPLLVINGDILTGVDFRAMLAFHKALAADMTVGIRRCELEIPYGVLECDGARVSAVREKPRSSFVINAGVYLLEPRAVREVPEGRRFDMTDLLARLLARGATVAAFPIVEYWLDIGQPADYEQAQADVRTMDLEI